MDWSQIRKDKAGDRESLLVDPIDIELYLRLDKLWYHHLPRLISKSSLFWSEGLRLKEQARSTRKIELLVSRSCGDAGNQQATIELSALVKRLTYSVWVSALHDRTSPQRLTIKASDLLFGLKQTSECWYPPPTESLLTENINLRS